MGLIVHAVGTVRGCDVAEPTFLSARYHCCWPLYREPWYQCAQVLYELVIRSLCRYADCVVLVGDLPPELEVPVLLQRRGDGAQVNHHLDHVTGTLLPGLRIDDDGFVVPSCNEVRLARQLC